MIDMLLPTSRMPSSYQATQRASDSSGILCHFPDDPSDMRPEYKFCLIELRQHYRVIFVQDFVFFSTLTSHDPVLVQILPSLFLQKVLSQNTVTVFLQITFSGAPFSIHPFKLLVMQSFLCALSRSENLYLALKYVFMTLN